jgi:hypothetical protein
MWLNGDKFELGAYRARCWFVTGPAERGGHQRCVQAARERGAVMSAPNSDRPPATARIAGRRRPLVLLVATCLMVTAAAVGASVALASRPSNRASVAAAGTEPAGPSRPAGQAGDQRAKPDGQTKAKGQARTDAGGRARSGARSRDSRPAPVDTARNAAVLPDGVHHVFIRSVDVANDRITVDVAQLFLDGDAAKAAIADGKSREEARYLTVWLRNQNPRLRSLPLAGDLRVDLFETCDESPVHAIKERQITPAC